MLLVHSQSTCDVCLDTYNLLLSPDGKTPWAIPCGHTFCRDCLQRTNPSNCPLCRKAFNPDRIKRLHVDRPTDSPENDTTRDVTNWLEQVVLASAGQSSSDEWKDVVRDANVWLEGRSPDAHPALRAAISLLERFKDMQTKHRDDKHMLRELKHQMARRMAELHDERERARTVEENLMRDRDRELDLLRHQLVYWNDNFPNESEQLRARIRREMGTPPAPTKTPTPPEAYVSATYIAAPSDPYASTTGHATNPLPRPPQPTTYPGEDSMREEMVDRWTGSAYSLTHIPPIGQPQPRPSGGAAFMPGARNPETIHPSRPPRFEGFTDEPDYRPGSPTPRPRPRSRGRHAENGERRRHRREGETEQEREERKRKHREKARARRQELEVDEEVQGRIPTSGNALGIRAYSSSTVDVRGAENGAYGLGSSSTGVNMIAGPSQAGPSRAMPPPSNPESYDSSLLDAPTPRRTRSPLPFSSSDAAAAPPVRSYPSHPPMQHPSTTPAPQHGRPHDSIDSWGTVSSQGVGSIIPNLVNFPPYPRGSNDGAGRPGEGDHARMYGVAPVLTLAMPGAPVAGASDTDTHRPQLSRHFTMPSTTDTVPQQSTASYEDRPTTAAGRRVSLSRSYSQSHTPRPSESQASVSTTMSYTFNTAHGRPWMQVGGVSQAWAAGGPYAPVPQTYAVVAPQVSIQSLHSHMGAGGRI